LLVLDRARGTLLARYEGVNDFLVPMANELTDRIYLASNDGLLVCLHDRDIPNPIHVKNVEEKKPSVRQPESGKPPGEKVPARPSIKPQKKDQDEK